MKHVKRGSISVNASKGFNVEVQVKQLCQLSYQQLSLLSETKELKIHIHVYIFNSLQKPKANKDLSLSSRESKVVHSVNKLKVVHLLLVKGLKIIYPVIKLISLQVNQKLFTQ